MILLEGLGNGHNDMVLMALMVLGVILWRRKAWWVAAAALSLGALTKATGLLMLPLFGVALLAEQPNWGRRLAKGAAILGIFLLLVLLLYSSVGPISQTLRGVTDMLTLRRVMRSRPVYGWYFARSCPRRSPSRFPAIPVVRCSFWSTPG